MAAVALAVALYRAGHDGRLPRRSTNWPDYLPAVPLDPIAGGGKPLGYVPDPHRPRVDHVGTNRIDDGGRPIDPSASRSENDRLRHEVLDLVRQPRDVPEDERLDVPASIDREHRPGGNPRARRAGGRVIRLPKRTRG